MKRFFLLLGVVGLAELAWPALPCRYLHEMTGEVVTPHHSFRAAAPAKPLKVLFLLDRRGARDAVEVVQRFAVEPTYFLMTPGPNLAKEDMYESAWEGTTFYEKTRELDEKLNRRYDLYVFGRKPFTSVGEEHRYRILKAVRDEGAGLLLVGDRGVSRLPYAKVYAEKLAAPAFFAPFARETPRTALSVYRVGKGRLVELNWASAAPAPFFALAPVFPVDNRWAAKYENAMALVGAVMRYAAGGETLLTQPVRTRVRDAYNAVVSDRTCAGTYFCDRIGANGALEVERCETASPVGGLAVTAPEVVRPGEAFAVTAVWRRASAEVVAACVETVDSPSHRVMTRRRLSLPADATNLVCSVADARIATKAGYVRVTLLDGEGRARDRAEVLQFHPSRCLPDYVQMGWDCVLSMHPLAGAGILVDRLGFTCGLTHPTAGGENIREMAVLNQSAVPYLTRIMVSAAPNGASQQKSWFFLDRAARERLGRIEGDLCFYRPEVQRVWADGIRHRMTNLAKYAPAFYNLGDENELALSAGFGAEDDRSFRAFLKEKYGTLAALNRAWRTNCTDFATVPHLRPEEAKRLGNLAAWGDHRAYLEKMYADIHAFCRTEIRKLDPGAPVGAEGSVPGDLELTFAALEFWGPYSNLVEDEVLRSLAPDRIRMLWWGGYPASHGGRGKTPFPLSLMKDLTTGTVMGNAWFDVSVGQNHGFFYSDLKVADDVAAYLPWHDRYKDGLAQLLIRNPLKDEGILLYWSHPSRRAALASEKCLSPTDGLSTLIKSFYRTGRSFEFVSSRTLARLAGAKVLFLCGATALSDDEVAAIRAFAARGGRVVADVEPAVMDEHLAWRETPALAGLWARAGNRLLSGKLSLAAAQAKTPAAFDARLAAHLPPAGVAEPAEPLDARAVLRTRAGRDFVLVSALWPAERLGARARIRLPQRGHVYSQLTGYQGCRQEWTLDFAEGPCENIAVFAEKQRPPEFSVADAVAGGDLAVTLPPLCDGRVYRLEVVDAAGARRFYRVFDRDGQAPRRLPLAFTEATGRWKLRLTDCATQLSSERTAEVSAP